jgi:hypothetical protein
MNLKISELKISGLFLMAIIVLSGVFFNEAKAQTPRKTKTGKFRPIVQPTTPINAEIVSRDADYTAQTQVVQPESNNNQTTATEDNSQDPENRIVELNERIQKLESQLKNNSDDKQKRLLMNLDILTRAEQRAETLRKQMFEMVEKESQIQTKLDQINYDIRPEIIERQVSFAGSLRPEDLRENRRKTLEVDKKNLQTLLTDIQTVRSNLEVNVQKADSLVQKLRDKIEKEIDSSLEEKPEN